MSVLSFEVFESAAKKMGVTDAKKIQAAFAEAVEMEKINLSRSAALVVLNKAKHEDSEVSTSDLYESLVALAPNIVSFVETTFGNEKSSQARGRADKWNLPNVPIGDLIVSVTVRERTEED